MATLTATPNPVTFRRFYYHVATRTFVCDASDLTGLLDADPLTAGITIVGQEARRHFTFDRTVRDREGEKQLDRFRCGDMTLEVFND